MLSSTSHTNNFTYVILSNGMDVFPSKLIDSSLVTKEQMIQQQRHLDYFYSRQTRFKYRPLLLCEVKQEELVWRVAKVV